MRPTIRALRRSSIAVALAKRAASRFYEPEVLMRSFVLGSALVALGSSARASDLTLSFDCDMESLSLGVEARVSEHVTVGGTFGFVPGPDLPAFGFVARYYFAPDLGGWHADLVGAFWAIEEMSANLDSVGGAKVGALFGHKWVLGPGFTVDLALGFGLRSYDTQEDVALDGPDEVDRLEPHALVDARVGWTF